MALHSLILADGRTCSIKLTSERWLGCFRLQSDDDRKFRLQLLSFLLFQRSIADDTMPSSIIHTVGGGYTVVHTYGNTA